MYSTEKDVRLYVDKKVNVKSYLDRFVRDGFDEAIREGYLLKPVTLSNKYGKFMEFYRMGVFKIKIIYSYIFNDKEDPDYYLCEDIIHSPMKIYAREYVVEV
jgi:hypothetical protein